MPAKKKAAVQSAGPGMMFSQQSFFIPSRGLDGGKVSAPPAAAQPFNNHEKKKAKTAPQSAGPGMMFSKKSFFVPNRDGGKVPIPPIATPDAHGNNRFQAYEPQRRFVFDKSTGEAYAEWINGVAVCVDTGQELFRSRQSGDEDSVVFSNAPFDYSVPKQRHPNDFSISTNDIVASGFLTLADFKAPDGATVRLAEYESYLKQRV